MFLEIYKLLQQAEVSEKLIGFRVGLPVKCLPFSSFSGLTLALVHIWAHEELTMLLEI